VRVIQKEKAIFKLCGNWDREELAHSKCKGKIHLTAVIQVTVSNFTYNFST
jgi:hypothetical protein